MEVQKKDIENLIKLKKEGPYWDFKREWYDEKHKQDLLHDIICMANNLANQDCYIIIGVDEENDYSLNDVIKDPNRKNTQKIVDFLRDKKFAGGIRPNVIVETIQFEENNIDVIVIKNSTNTPYYLSDKFNGVFPYQIYTRVQDTNTPLNSSADIDKVEWLWKKRFGLIQIPIERVKKFLQNANDWENGPNGEMQKYYKPFPEYTLIYDFAEDERHGYEYYLFSQCNTNSSWMNIKIFYNQTLLTEQDGVLLDGGRYMAVCPKTGGISLNNRISGNIFYKYMIKNSFVYILNEFLYHHEWSHEARYSHDNYFEVILLFESDNERKQFHHYVERNWGKRSEYLNLVNCPDIPQIKGYKKDAFKEEYENALILKIMLNNFRST